VKKGRREAAREGCAAEKRGAPSEASEAIKGRLALPVPEVAKLLGISSSAVRLMIARGVLPARNVGGGTERVTYIVPCAGLLSWLDGTSPSSAEDYVT
jgi:excisionase family DNA binding protein